MEEHAALIQASQPATPIGTPCKPTPAPKPSRPSNGVMSDLDRAVSGIAADAGVSRGGAGPLPSLPPTPPR